jgi:hypothetical protein
MHRMAHLRVVKRCETKGVPRRKVVELHVELAAGHQLAADHRSQDSIAPTVDDLDVGTVTTGEKFEAVDNMVAAGARSEHATLQSRIDVDGFLALLERFALKVSLAYAHYVLGASYSASNEAARLRTILWNPTARWKAVWFVGSAGADPNNPATIEQLRRSTHRLELGVDNRGVWVRGALFGSGPLQWLLQISDDASLASALNTRPAVAIIDATYCPKMTP